MSALKIWATETYQRISLALMDLAGEYGSWAGADPAGGQAPALLFNTTPPPSTAAATRSSAIFWRATCCGRWPESLFNIARASARQGENG